MRLKGAGCDVKTLLPAKVLTFMRALCESENRRLLKARRHAEESMFLIYEWAFWQTNRVCCVHWQLRLPDILKIYKIVLDEDAAADGNVKVIDESGEGYLYSSGRFVPIRVPSAVKNCWRWPRKEMPNITLQPTAQPLHGFASDELGCYLWKREKTMRGEITRVNEIPEIDQLSRLFMDSRLAEGDGGP